jgi:apolipoprotein N-acyltransferase
MAALRAVENRTPVVRAANTGITGVVDATGEIRQTTQLFVREVIIGEITPNKGPRTFYSLYGNIFAYLCLLLMVTVSLLARKNSSGK